MWLPPISFLPLLLTVLSTAVGFSGICVAYLGTGLVYAGTRITHLFSTSLDSNLDLDGDSLKLWALTGLSVLGLSLSVIFLSKIPSESAYCGIRITGTSLQQDYTDHKQSVCLPPQSFAWFWMAWHGVSATVRVVHAVWHAIWRTCAVISAVLNVLYHTFRFAYRITSLIVWIALCLVWSAVWFARVVFYTFNALSILVSSGSSRSSPFCRAISMVLTNVEGFASNLSILITTLFLVVYPKFALNVSVVMATTCQDLWMVLRRHTERLSSCICASVATARSLPLFLFLYLRISLATLEFCATNMSPFTRGDASGFIPNSMDAVVMALCVVDKQQHSRSRRTHETSAEVPLSFASRPDVTDNEEFSATSYSSDFCDDDVSHTIGAADPKTEVVSSGIASTQFNPERHSVLAKDLSCGTKTPYSFFTESTPRNLLSTLSRHDSLIFIDGNVFSSINDSSPGGTTLVAYVDSHATNQSPLASLTGSAVAEREIPEDADATLCSDRETAQPDANVCPNTKTKRRSRVLEGDTPVIVLDCLSEDTPHVQSSSDEEESFERTLFGTESTSSVEFVLDACASPRWLLPSRSLSRSRPQLAPISMPAVSVASVRAQLLQGFQATSRWANSSGLNATADPFVPFVPSLVTPSPPTHQADRFSNATSSPVFSAPSLPAAVRNPRNGTRNNAAEGRRNAARSDCAPARAALPRSEYVCEGSVEETRPEMERKRRKTHRGGKKLTMGERRARQRARREAEAAATAVEATSVGASE